MKLKRTRVNASDDYLGRTIDVFNPDAEHFGHDMILDFF